MFLHHPHPVLEERAAGLPHLPRVADAGKCSAALLHCFASALLQALSLFHLFVPKHCAHNFLRCRIGRLATEECAFHAQGEHEPKLKPH
eukprot:scaffold311724_cov35-Tisochrysis_lutea.AAC.3